MLSIVIALLAFFIALVALWLTSDIVKKVENQNEQFVRAHITTLREEIRDVEKVLNKTARMVKAHDEGQSSLDKRLNDHTKAFDELRARINTMSDQLEQLDRSIPSRYRVRIAKPDATSDAKPGDKPRIQ